MTATGNPQPKGEPGHDIVGNYYLALGDGTVSDIFFCEAFDARQGYAMVSLSDDTRHRQISDVEVGRGFNRIYESLGGGRLLCEAGRLTEDEVRMVKDHVADREGIPSVRIA